MRTGCISTIKDGKRCSKHGAPESRRRSCIRFWMRKFRSDRNTGKNTDRAGGKRTDALTAPTVPSHEIAGGRRTAPERNRLGSLDEFVHFAVRFRKLSVKELIDCVKDTENRMVFFVSFADAPRVGARIEITQTEGSTTTMPPRLRGGGIRSEHGKI